MKGVQCLSIFIVHMTLVIFVIWIAHMDYYFDLYEFSDKRRVWFAKQKLKHSAQDY